VFASASDSEAVKMITFGYWKIRGLGAAARMMLEYAGVEYEDVQYDDGAKWFKEDKPKLAKKNPLINLPYLCDGDVVISHSNSIYMYLGDRLGLTPKEEAARLLDNQALMECADIRNALMDLVYPFRNVCRSQEEHEVQRGKVLETNLPNSYAKLEAALEMSGTPFMGGETPGPSDFHIFEMIDQHEKMAAQVNAASPIEAFPKLKTMYNKFFDMPQLKKYFASEAYQLDMNNRMATPYVY